jgi:hypothetical protein
MQTNALFLVCGIHRLLFENRQRSAAPVRETIMSKIASVALAPSGTLFTRLFAAIDRLLLAYAEMEIRNGDIPRSGI